MALRIALILLFSYLIFEAFSLDCKAQNPSVSLTSLGTKLLLTALWRTKDACSQVMRYRKAGNEQNISKPANSKKVEDGYIYAATVGVENEVYYVSFGHGEEWTEPLSFDFHESLFEAYIINDLNHNDTKSVEVVETIRQSATESNATLKILVDLTVDKGGLPLLSKEYYRLLEPILKILPYQAIPVYHNDFPFVSAYSLDLKDATVSFPLLSDVKATNQVSVLALESFLDLAFDDSKPGFRIIFQRDPIKHDASSILSGLYESRNVSLVFTGEPSEYNRLNARSLVHVQAGARDSFGVITIVNSTYYTYKHMKHNGEVVDSFTVNSPALNGGISDNSKERTIALIVVICSLAFLCYFIYSWVSCYMKKPKVRELETPHGVLEEDAAEDMGEAYDMQPIVNSV